MKWQCASTSLILATALGVMPVCSAQRSVHEAQAPGQSQAQAPTRPAQAGGAADDSAGDAPADPGPLATDLSPALAARAVDQATRRVADWELARAQPHFDRTWSWSLLYSGLLATADSTGDPKYRRAVQTAAQKFRYQLPAVQASSQPDPLGDSELPSMGQVYVDLYLLAGKNDSGMIRATQAALDAALGSSRPTADSRPAWQSSDALLLAAPGFAAMSAATGDVKYNDYLYAQWQRTSRLLYDPDEHLYAQDAALVNQRGSNGKKIFSTRDQGFVMAGLARTLAYPGSNNGPGRAFYLQQLREISGRMARLQGRDGLWRASLLDPEHSIDPEVCGSALLVYAMAWGVNAGVLDAPTYLPVIERAWYGLLQHVYADGRLGGIAPPDPGPGTDAGAYQPAASYNYGVGAYLLAASELKRLVGVPADPPLRAHLVLPTPANPQLPSLFLVGGSTVRNGTGDGAHNQMGWGEPLASFFDPTKINVVNRAVGGRSARSYITENYWNQTLALMKPGDVVLIQFGRDDDAPLDDPVWARGSLPGVGDDSLATENPVLHRHEVVRTFGFYLDQYVKAARAKGVTPILCSPVPQQLWRDGAIVTTDASYARWARQVAENDHVGFIDLNEIVARRYDQMGQAAVAGLFADAETNTTPAGATLNAESVVAGLKALAEDPVAGDFAASAAKVPATPSH